MKLLGEEFWRHEIFDIFFMVHYPGKADQYGIVKVLRRRSASTAWIACSRNKSQGPFTILYGREKVRGWKPPLI